MTDHPVVTQVDQLAAELLSEARTHPANRAARTLVTGTSQRVTLIALTADAELAEHDSPPAATLHVIAGQALLRTATEERRLGAGQLTPVPPTRHSLEALTDCAVLLTVALR